MSSEITGVTPANLESSWMIKRLWKGGGLVAVIIVTFAIGNIFLPADKAVTQSTIGLDFLPFYFGGTCARTGQLQDLFNLDATRAFQKQVADSAHLDLGTALGPWWNPPFAAWMFAPLSALPFRDALHLWWGIGSCCLAISMILLARMLTGGWKVRLLVPFLTVCSMPFIQAFGHGQNTFFSLVLLTIVVVLWRGGKSLSAGLVCGLLFYKPQLGAVVALVLCISQGRRAMLGVAITGASLLAINIITMPGTISAMLHQMPGNMHWMQEENRYHWERHITFKGFWRLLIQGHETGATSPVVLAMWFACEGALLAGLIAVVVKNFREAKNLRAAKNPGGAKNPGDATLLRGDARSGTIFPPDQPASARDRLIALAITSMPLLMPFYFDYDLLLVSVAAVVFAADCQRMQSMQYRTPADFPSKQSSAKPWEERWLPGAWATFFFVSEFGTILGAHTRVQPTVILLAVLAGLQIRRALRPSQSAAVVGDSRTSAPVAMAA
jgi:hypothetical protein